MKTPSLLGSSLFLLPLFGMLHLWLAKSINLLTSQLPT